MEKNLPFKQHILGNKKIRTFSENVESEELKWHFDEEDRMVKVLSSNNWQLQMDNELPIVMKEGKTYFIPKGVYHRTIKGSGDLKVEITESSIRYREVIRKVVKDIVSTIKQNKPGEYYFPEEDTYKFTNFPVEFSVELSLIHTDEFDGFKMNGEYSSEDDVIELLVIINPSNFTKYLYEIIGELNEILSHEIEHMLQYYKGENIKPKKIKNPIDYYLQSHEIPAQIKGFKRLSKLRRKPFEEIVRNWFETHEDIHSLNKKEQEIVIKKILEYGQTGDR